MSQYVVFFPAEDDAVAAAVLPGGPGRVFTTVAGAYFDVDDAMSIWEHVASGRTGRWESAGDRPRMVAGGDNDGTAVYAMPAAWVAALAQAEVDALRSIAVAWHSTELRNDADLDSATAHRVITGVAALATEATRSGQRVYSWASDYPPFRPE